MFYLNQEEFLEMAEVYKKACCPLCDEPNLIYKGYTFFDGDMAGQLHMDCDRCQMEFYLHVHSLKNKEILN